MAVIGANDIGDGKLSLILTHDPTSQATDAPKGSKALVTSTNVWYKKTDDGSSTNWVVDPEASAVPYDNTTSGLTADDVQDAIDELAAGAGASGTELAAVRRAATGRSRRRARVVHQRAAAAGRVATGIGRLPQQRAVATGASAVVLP